MFGALLAAAGSILQNSVSGATAGLVVRLLEEALASTQTPEIGAIFGLVSAQLEAHGISAEELQAAQTLLTDLLRFVGLVTRHNLLPSPGAATTVLPPNPPAV